MVAQPRHAPKYGPIAQLGERSVRIREVKGSNPSRSTFSSSVILTLLLFFCIHISHALALGPRGIRTARPCRRQGKQSAQCNGDDRSQWLKQGGAVGAAFGFFKALPRGCGKISQRNPSLLLRARVPTSRNVYRGDFRFCLKNFGRPCRAPNPEVGCEPGGVINVLFENPSVSRFFLCILQSAAGKRIAFMPLFRKFLQKSPHHRRSIQP